MARKDYQETLRKNKEYYHALKDADPFRHKYLYIKSSAKRKGLPFDLTPDYLKSIWTGLCAISEKPIELYNKRNHEYHAELDRIHPDKGYTQGNVQWTSRRFNRLKGDMSKEDLQHLLKWFDVNG